MGGRLVYSTGPDGPRDKGSCPRCGRQPCACETVRVESPARQSVRVRRERSGRGGKTVTVVGPLLVSRDTARELLTGLKRDCGTGGALKSGRTPDGEPCYDLELQGDRVSRVLERLQALGFPARQAGG